MKRDLDDWQPGPVVQQPPGMAPEPGDTYRNRHSGFLCTIVEIEQLRKTMVAYRHQGAISRTYLHAFLEHWERCTHDGQRL